ncbi:hypothetical protein LINPERHAP1_LOCUS38868 [Linum perenne]
MNNPDQLWAKLIKGLYFPDKNFLSTVKGKKSSWIWASLY